MHDAYPHGCIITCLKSPFLLFDTDAARAGAHRAAFKIMPSTPANEPYSTLHYLFFRCQNCYHSSSFQLRPLLLLPELYSPALVSSRALQSTRLPQTSDRPSTTIPAIFPRRSNVAQAQADVSSLSAIIRSIPRTLVFSAALEFCPETSPPARPYCCLLFSYIALRAMSLSSPTLHSIAPAGRA